MSTFDEEVTIDLDDAAVRELEAAYGISAAKAEPAAPAKPAAPKAEAKAPAKTDEAVKPAENDLLRRVREAEERAASERQKRIEAEKLAHERGTAAVTAAARAAEGDFHAVANALAKATADSETLKRQHQAALEAGDYAAAAETADKMAEAKAKIVQLQDGKATLEDRLRASKEKAEAAAKAEPPKPEADADPMERFFAQTGMPPKAQAWFRSHPEVAPHNDKAAYYKALASHETIIKSGVQEGSDEYYQKLDNMMGFTVGDSERDERDEGGSEVVVEAEKPAVKQPQKRVAAPVARDSVLHRRADGKVQLRLTAEQARMADELGMSRTNYAKHLLAAEQQGKLGGHNL